MSARGRRWLRRAATAAAALLLLVLAAAGWYVWRALPQRDGTLTLAGPGAALTIERDAEGVPTIVAASAVDAAFGLGFVHAQDRLWQLETHRRIASGRLAEAFGPSALETDRFLRALGVQRAAQAQWARTDAAARAQLEAYAAGINAFLRDAGQALPPEFLLLGLRPEPWRPQDTLAWGVMMAWDLGGNWSNELLRMRLALTLPVARIDELLPPYPGQRPLPVADYAALFRALRVDGELGRRALSAAPVSGVEGLGSNNWVVAGTRSATGAPLLANDPHLRLSAPALWYLARLRAPDLEVAGATLPGVPGVVLGQNRHIAWGFTNTAPDVQDLYLEQIDPADPTRYRTPEGWATFERFEETIRVRGAPDETLVVRATRHGPVISDGGAGAGLTGPAGQPAYALALRWTALDPDPGTLQAHLAFGTARSVEAFVAAAQRQVAPMQNMLVADAAGHIAFVAAGRVPLRGPDHDLKGLVPAPGWEARYDWIGFLDPAATPRERDPARGWLATANQRIHGDDYPHFLTSEWTVPYRQQRIEALLQARPVHDLASLRAIQADVVSLAARPLLPVLRRTASGHALAAAAQRELEDFDGTMAADRAAPLIFWAWVRQLTEGIFADELGAAWAGSARGFREALEGVLARDDAWWCDDKRTPAAETCAQQSVAAFERALDELRALQGDDPSRWRWGAVHQARSEHRPFSRVPALAPFFGLHVPVGGDTYSVNVTRVTLKADARGQGLYGSEHAASLRGLYDLADPTRSRIMISSGPSGLVFSPQYRSLMGRWAEVRDLPLWQAPAEHRLVLQPAAPR